MSTRDEDGDEAAEDEGWGDDENDASGTSAAAAAAAAVAGGPGCAAAGGRGGAGVESDSAGGALRGGAIHAFYSVQRTTFKPPCTSHVLISRHQMSGHDRIKITRVYLISEASNKRVTPTAVKP